MTSTRISMASISMRTITTCEDSMQQAMQHIMLITMHPQTQPCTIIISHSTNWWEDLHPSTTWCSTSKWLPNNNTTTKKWPFWMTILRRTIGIQPGISPWMTSTIGLLCKTWEGDQPQDCPQIKGSLESEISTLHRLSEAQMRVLRLLKTSELRMTTAQIIRVEVGGKSLTWPAQIASMTLLLWT